MISKIFIALLITIQTSIYSLSFTSGGDTVNLGAYQGKKMLFVNIASGSPYASQLAGLQQLQQQFGDSLVVIAFPTNSFGNEPLASSQIRQLCQTQYGTTFLIAEKGEVTGASKQPVYNWLSKQSENGVMNQEVMGDFQKYLVDGHGNLIGVFAGVVEPTNAEIITAINQN
jgi:glutathione peroxidase